jgi:uncharacterized protein with PIN domain
MARHFADTSALVKLYRDEPRSEEVRGAIQMDDVLVISEFTLLEFPSAFYGLVRQGLIERRHAEARIEIFQQDLANYEVVTVETEILKDAARCVDRFAVSEGLRPPDAVQLASAHQARTLRPVDLFLTTDSVLGECAAACGFTVGPSR